MNILKYTNNYIRRTPYQAFAAISIMLLTFLVGGLFFLVSIGSSILIEYYERKPEVVVFFKDSKKEADIKKLQEKLQNMDQVASVKYVSKEAAFEENKKQYLKNPLVLEMVPTDILPASIAVATKKIEDLSEIAKTLNIESDIEGIIFPEDVVNTLGSWIVIIRTVGITFVSLLGLTSLFTVLTVISMKIALRKNEIEILQLVGATTSYIRNPFIVEGAFYGACGALIGWLINVGLLLYLTPYLSSKFAELAIFPISPLFYVLYLAVIEVCGILLGMLASIMALNRYLR